jgi:hypothetical protein
MVEVTNKFENIPATDVYVDFGLEQIVRSNERFLLWAQHQAFLAGASLEEIRGTHFFSHLTVGGNAQTHDYILPESSDSVNWNIRFAAETDNGGLDNALSQEWRLRSFPSFSTFNSAPSLFSTGNHIEVRVKNGERGWVKQGLFPESVRIAPGGIDPENPPKRLPDYAQQIDIRREALAGFEAAHLWQRFRAMALVSSDVLSKTLSKELAEKNKRMDSFDFCNKRRGTYDYYNAHRSRVEVTYPLFVNLLPDIHVDEGVTALQPFYVPGALEASLALEMEHVVRQNYGGPIEEIRRPIRHIQGMPIEITKTGEGTYDAVMRLKIYTYISGEEDPGIREALQESLGSRFDIDVLNQSEMHVALTLPDAHEIAKAIRNGETDTPVHQFAYAMNDAIRSTDIALSGWYNQLKPGRAEMYAAQEMEAKRAHFALPGE